MTIDLTKPIFVECPDCKGQGTIYQRMFGKNIRCLRCGGSRFVLSKTIHPATVAPTVPTDVSR